MRASTPISCRTPTGASSSPFPTKRFTLIGTTDVPYEGDPAKVAISAEEIAYLCEVINAHFVKQITPADVVWTYAGVRPLYDDESASASAVTRDYVLELDDADGRRPSAVGVRRQDHDLSPARRACAGEAEAAFSPQRAALDHAAALPGGDIANADFEGFLRSAQRRRPWLPAALARRYARAYGTRIGRLLGDAQGINDLGRHLGDDLYSREIDYLTREEWARTAQDILWRRSKLGLHVAPATAAALEAWLGETPSGSAARAGT